MLDILDVQAVPRHFCSFDFNLDFSGPAQGFDLHIGAAGNAFQHTPDSFRCAFERVEIIAEQFDRDIGAHARNHFVHPHFQRLREVVGDARNVLQFLIKRLNQPFTRRGRFPLGYRFQDHIHIALIDAHRVGGQIGTP